eukprot:TRINITY_DN2351_c0_g2_i1.p1 TRINITY_DN2351_c0_g2~~TRINITY_DN2351_c0_g2_i1.p1  ORF type:complete len:212 (-),score=60.95 TRINITY_DN2351_c0_g2_i1:63-698(-)
MGALCGKADNGGGNNQDVPLFKIVVVGNVMVGKSSVMIRYCQNEFVNLENEQSLANVEENMTKTVDLPNIKQTVKLQIWDTAGQEKFRHITKSFYGQCSGVVVVFSVVDQESFKAIKNWVKDAVTFGGKENPDFRCLILGNKCDLAANRAVDQADINNLLEELYNNNEEEEALLEVPAIYHEVSALTGNGINDAFGELAEMLYETRSPNRI